MFDAKNSQRRVKRRDNDHGGRLHAILVVHLLLANFFNESFVLSLLVSFSQKVCQQNVLVRLHKLIAMSSPSNDDGAVHDSHASYSSTRVRRDDEKEIK